MYLFYLEENTRKLPNMNILAEMPAVVLFLI